MQNTRQSWLDAAHGADWFQLNRHDEPEPADPPEPDGDPDPSGDPEPEPEPEGADKLGDAGKKALERMKAERAAAKKEAAEAKKAAAEALRKVQEFEDRDKSELDKATEKAEKAEARAKAATDRAVKAEVKALAKEFADPTDTEMLGDLSRYVDDDGAIDTEAIEADLADLLERKPHLRRPAAEPEKRRQPKPDPSQGPRPPEPPSDFRTASRDEYEAALAKYGVSPRR